MIIKLLHGNPRKSALVIFSKADLLKMELTAGSMNLQSGRTRQLLADIFAAMETICGLSRNGNYVFVECRPLKNGGCRFLLQYTEEPSGRLFQFRESNDLLDAIIQLQKNEEFNPPQLKITCSDNSNTIYIPAGVTLTQNDIAILNEYSE